MRRFVFLALIATLACQQPASQTPPAAHRLRVGLLTPGSVSDNGWNAIAYEGLLRIQRELGAEISHQEARTPAEFEEGFRSYGAKGFDLAFGHGFEYQDAALKAGTERVKHRDALRDAKSALEMSRYYEEARELSHRITTWALTLGPRPRRFLPRPHGGDALIDRLLGNRALDIRLVVSTHREARVC